MPRISRQPRKTALGAFVRRERLARGTTQREFEQLLGIEETHRLYVSKIETGAILRPSSEFLEALARLTGRPMMEFEALTAGEADPQTASIRKPFTVAFGHCVWAAPLVLTGTANEDGRLPFRFVSALDNAGRPLWSDDEDGKKLIWGRDAAFNESNNLKYLSGVQSKEMLLRSEVDLAGLPGDVIEADGKEILSVATLVDSAVSCTLLLKETMAKRIFGDAVNDGEDVRVDKFLEQLYHIDHNFPYRVGVEDGTVAYCMLQSGADGALKIPEQFRSTVKWNLPETCERTLFRDPEEARKLWAEKDMVGVLTWEPHATWLFNNEGLRQGGDKPVKVRLFFPLGFDKRPRHLTFEIAMLTKAATSDDPRYRELRAALPDLVVSLERHARSLNMIDHRIGPGTAQQKLIEVGNYFRLCTDASARLPAYQPALHAIGEIHYSVKWNPEALELMQFRPRYEPAPRS